MTKLFDLDTILNFWFRNSGQASSFELTFWSILFGSFLFLGFFAFLYAKTALKKAPPKQKLFSSIYTIFFSFGFSGILFMILRYLSPDFLGVRAIPMTAWLIGFFWAAFLIFRYFKKSPIEVLKFETRVLKERYFKKSKA